MKREDHSLKTKKELSEALKRKMENKSFEKITVTELVEDTNINRKTFYYHFQDIYELLKWTLENEAIDVVKHFDLLVDYEEAISFVLQYIQENKHMITCAYDSIGREELKRFFQTDFHDIIVSLIDSEEQKFQKELDPSYKEFITEFYMEALSGILVDWIRYSDRLSEEQVVDYTLKTIRYSLLGIFKNI